MVSWTNCAGKHQHCGALGWAGLIISLWNIHYSTWNYIELTGLRVCWEVHDPLEQTQSFWHETFPLCSLLIQSAASYMLQWQWFYSVYCCNLGSDCCLLHLWYVPHRGPDAYMEPLVGNVIEIIMLQSRQDFLAVLSFRFCHFITPFTNLPYSSGILSFLSCFYPFTPILALTGLHCSIRLA